MSGATPPIPVWAFIACNRATYTFTCFHEVQEVLFTRLRHFGTSVPDCTASHTAKPQSHYLPKTSLRPVSAHCEAESKIHV
jgi:hypothetical protein